MPNTSATIGKSATGIAMNTAVDIDMRKQLLGLLESIGLVKEVEEDDLHAVTALSGSGPAYVYYLAEALEEAAISKGLTKDVARSLIIQTLEGAAAMMKVTGTEPAELRENVTRVQAEQPQQDYKHWKTGFSKKQLLSALRKRRLGRVN